MTRKIETLANISIIIAALLFCTTLVHEKWLHRPSGLAPAAQTDNRLQGTNLHIDGVNWESANKTVVIALSTQCHFCRESVPFYKELTALPAVKSKRLLVVTVFPQQQGEAESFVKASEIRANIVLSMPLQTLGTSSTPTLFLVNQAGKVERLWIGVLSPTQQKDLLGELAKLG
jgi:hypothetical protein